MNLTKNKKIVGGVILGGAILFTGANAYASTVLDTNLFSLISKTMNQVASFFTKETEDGVENALVGKTEEMRTYVDQRTDDVLTELNEAKNAEIGRGESEIDLYYNQLITETDAAFTAETNEIKGEMKSIVDQEIAKTKSDLTTELEEALNDNLKELNRNMNNGHEK